jgi:iron complex outermembrane recepter protein
MRNNFPSSRRALTLAVMTGLSLPVVAYAQDSDNAIEEVVVTGSFLRGSPLDAPSPVTTIDRDSIDSQGASGIWDLIRNLDVNQGSDTSTAGTNDAGQLTGTASINLRNLGGNSTLTLINGKRFTPAAVVTSSGQEFVDINTIPLVMTDRVEVLTDGGSALYGSDAVAGVVNVMMRTDFEGLELFVDTQGVEESGGTYENTFSGIWGTSFNDGDTRVVLSAEYFERDPVRLRDAQYYEEGRTIANGDVGAFRVRSPLGGNLNPAYIDFPLTQQQTIERMTLGESVSGTAGVVFSDPLCESLSGADGSFYVDNRFTGFGRRTGNCSENNLDNEFISIGQERASLAASFEHTFSENAEFYSFLQHSENDTTREWDGIAFSRTLHLVHSPAVLGALAPFAGNAPLAAPAANNPNLASNGGFGEGWIGGGVQTGWPRNGEGQITRNMTSGAQAGLRGEFSINSGRVLNYDVSASWSSSSIEQDYTTLMRDRTEMALIGLGGENCTPNGRPDVNWAAASPALAGLAPFTEIVFPNYQLNTKETVSYALTSTNHGQDGCQFFNPFLTSLTDPSMANDPALIDWMEADILRADKRNSLLVFDAIVSGELFEMNGGTAAFATGFQRRERNARSIAPAINLPGITTIAGYEPGPFGAPNAFNTEVTNNLECSNCAFNFDDSRNVNAVFLELSVPFAENVETQIALRWEDYGGAIGSNVSPKIAMSWRPIDELLLRGSFSQSFRAPNIGVVNQAFDAFGTTILDPLRNQDVRAGLLPPTTENALANDSYTVGAPNPNLGNETADTFNVGFQWTPSGKLDGLSVGADVWRFEISDRVLPLIPRAAINPEIEKFQSVVGDSSQYIFNDTIDIDNRGPDGQVVACNPDTIAAEFGANSDERRNCVVNPEAYKVAGVNRTVNDEDGGLTTLVLPAVNAGNIEVQGIDVSLGYSWNSDFGQFSLGLNYTHVDEYLVKDIPGLELGLQSTGVFDAAGVDGETAIVREVPDNKGTITLNWAKNNHRVALFNRHIGSFQVLGHNDYLANPNRTDIQASFARPKVDSYNTIDLQYSYSKSWDNSALGTSVFTFGVNDLTDADVPLFRRDSYNASVFDARGRRWYARVLQRF